MAARCGPGQDAVLLGSQLVAPLLTELADPGCWACLTPGSCVAHLSGPFLPHPSPAWTCAPARRFILARSRERPPAQRPAAGNHLASAPGEGRAREMTMDTRRQAAVKENRERQPRRAAA